MNVKLNPDSVKRNVIFVTYVGAIINLALTACKIIVGYLSGSQALIADGVHSLSDLATDVALLFGVKYWTKPADSDHPYGHGRIEALIALLIAVALAAVGLGIAYKGLTSLRESHSAAPDWIAFLVAVVSIVSKELLYQWTAITAKKIKSNAMLANAWHHRSDSFSSYPVAIAILVAIIWPQWSFIDHLGAAVVAGFIIYASWSIMYTALLELTDGGASDFSRNAIASLAKTVPGVVGAHEIRTRRIGSGLQVDLHLLVNGELSVRNGHSIAELVKSTLLNSELDILDVVVHIEPEDSND